MTAEPDRLIVLAGAMLTVLALVVMGMLGWLEERRDRRRQRRRDRYREQLRELRDARRHLRPASWGRRTH